MEFKVGDKVKCINVKVIGICAGRTDMLNNVYTVKAVRDITLALEEMDEKKYTPLKERFILVPNQPEEKEEISQEDIDEDDVCDCCVAANDWSESNGCGRMVCSEAMELYLEENNLTLKEETVNSAIRKVFKDDSLELAEKIEAEFGAELDKIFNDSFTGELFLKEYKVKYTEELTNRENKRLETAPKS